MQRYVFRDGVPRQQHADPQAYGMALEALRDENGMVQPDDLWRAAEHPNHAMHGEFQWDRDKAAEAHWRSRARTLIGMILVVGNDDENTLPTKAYYNLTVGTPKRRNYISSETIADDAVYRHQMHITALSELRAFNNRFRRLLAASQPLDAALQTVVSLLEDAVRATHTAPPKPPAIKRRRG